MDDAVERVEISAATLTQILRELRSSPGDSDGLLFGRLHRGIKHNLQDEPLGDSPTREERVAIITGCCCPGSLLSFYTGAGSVDGAKLELVARGKTRHKWGSDPLIGWFLGRRSSPMRPSMREASVSHSLCSKPPAFFSPSPKVSLVPYHGSSSSSSDGSSNDSEALTNHQVDESPPPPFLFMLLTEAWSVNPIGTQEYKVFQYRTLDRTFHGRRLVIRNVGRASGSTQGEAYESFLPVAPLPWVMDPSFRDGEGDEADSWRLVGEAAPEPETKNNNNFGSRSLIRRKQQRLLEMFAEKLSVEQLHDMAGNTRGAQLVELLYSRMLNKQRQLLPEAHQSSPASQKQGIWTAEQ